MYAFRNRLSAAFVWALVPLTMVSGMPRISCICPNGRHKMFCGQQASQGCCAHGESDTGNCACCHKSAVAEQPKPAACSTCQEHKSPWPDRPTVSKTCCLRYMVVPDVSPSQKVVSAPNSFHDLAVLDFVPRVMLVSPAAPTGAPTRNPDLPVPDLVIAHQVFLI